MKAETTYESQELVYPASPSVLEGRDVYRMESNNLLINFTLNTAYIVPALLDVPRLRDALACTLALFPLFCGTLLREPELAITVSSLRPIPLMIQHEREGMPPSSSRAAVVVPRPGPLIDKVDPLKLLSGDEPELLKVTLVMTESSGKTLVGVSCSHIIADHFIVLKFLRTWSQYYTDSCAPIPEPRPVYDLPVDLPSPTDPARVEYMRSKLPPILFHTFPLDNISPSIFAPFEITRVDIPLTSYQVAILRDALMSITTSVHGSGEVVQLSRQDALSAFIATAMSLSYEQPITQITNVVNCRGFNPCVIPNEAVGNALLYAVTDPVDPVGLEREMLRETVLAYARAIRLSLQAARAPEYVHDFLALAGREWLAAASANRGHYIEETPGHVVINAYYRIDWASAHFGFPGQVCWQHPDNIMTDNYVMMFPTNPVCGEDRVWHTDDGACEMTFNVKSGREGKMKEAVALLWDVLVGDETGPVVMTSEAVL